MSEKSIVFKTQGIKQTWRGHLTELLERYPNAEILEIKEFAEVDLQ